MTPADDNRGTPNLTREIHEATARSANRAQASTRPPGTDEAALERMVQDVLDKLDVQPGMSVVEIGCGTGVLGLPLAQVAGRYVGLDFSPTAVQVLREALETQGLAGKGTAEVLDILSVPVDEIQRLGAFDRVLLYAVLHYARTDEEGRGFITRVIAMTRPGGRALVGSLPLDELNYPTPKSRGLLRKALARLRWVLSKPPGMPHDRKWKTRSASFQVAQLLRRRRQQEPGFATPRLPAGYCIPLSKGLIEGWLSEAPDEITWRWLTPAIGVPLHPTRADLMIERASRVPH